MSQERPPGSGRDISPSPRPPHSLSVGQCGQPGAVLVPHPPSVAPSGNRARRRCDHVGPWHPTQYDGVPGGRAGLDTNGHTRWKPCRGGSYDAQSKGALAAQGQGWTGASLSPQRKHSPQHLGLPGSLCLVSLAAH